MNVSSSTNRRQFLKTAGAAFTTFNIVPRHVLGGSGFVAPSEKVNIALIGAGGRGVQNMRGLFRENDAQIIAVADSAESYPLGRFYRSDRITDAGRKPAPTIKRSLGHQREWLDTCKGGAPAGSNFDYGARLTEIALLGVLALRTGRRIEWDAEKMTAKGFREADGFIRELDRKGWDIA